MSSIYGPSMKLTYSMAEELKEEPARPASELKKRIAENKGAVKAPWKCKRKRH